MKPLSKKTLIDLILYLLIYLGLYLDNLYAHATLKWAVTKFCGIK